MWPMGAGEVDLRPLPIVRSRMLAFEEGDELSFLPGQYDPSRLSPLGPMTAREEVLAICAGLVRAGQARTRLRACSSGTDTL
jgi:hypothetical protein